MVDVFIEWWASLTPEERRIDHAKRRKAYWTARRTKVLFGLLECDALFGMFDAADISATVPTLEQLRRVDSDAARCTQCGGFLGDNGCVSVGCDGNE